MHRAESTGLRTSGDGSHAWMAGIAMTLCCLLWLGAGALANAADGEHGTTFDGPGSKLYYEVLGEGDGTPLVVLNGGPGFSHDHLHPSPVWEALGKRRPVVLYDQRGTGRSVFADAQQPCTACGLDEQVADLEALRLKLGAQRLDVLGHSWGGFLGMAYATRHPDHVARLVLVDSSAPQSKDTVYLFSEIFPDLQDQRGVATSAGEGGGHTDITDAENADDTLGYLKMLFHDPDRRDAFIEQAKAFPYGRSAAVGDAVWQSLEHVDLGPAIAKLAMPVLVVTGRYDANVAPVVAWRIHRAIPGSRFVVFERSGHLPFYEEPERFVREVEDFLDAQ